MWICLKFFVFFPLLKVFGDELVIIHSPSSIQFEGHEPLPTSKLKELYSACLSFTTDQDTNWDGMKIVDPFSLPSVIINFVVENSGSFDKLNGQKYPLIPDEGLDETFHSMERKALERDAGDTSLIKKIILDKRAQDNNVDVIYKDDKFKMITSGSPVVTPVEDRIEVLKIHLNQVVNEISSISKDDGQVKLIWIVIKDLEDLLNVDGNEKDLNDNKILMEAAVQLFADELNNFYNQALITSIATTSYAHEDRDRVKRSVANDVLKIGDLNLADDYDADFPVIFNIILWTCLTLVFALLAISITIAKMDPGRDSIIYRMTSNRMKKEN